MICPRGRPEPETQIGSTASALCVGACPARGHGRYRGKSSKLLNPESTQHTANGVSVVLKCLVKNFKDKYDATAAQRAGLFLRLPQSGVVDEFVNGRRAQRRKKRSLIGSGRLN